MMSDDGESYLGRVIREGNDWHRLADERGAELIQMNSALREIVLMLARRLRQASRDLRRVERGKPGEYPIDIVPFYKGAFHAAQTSYDSAQRTLRRNTRRTLERNNRGTQ